MYGGKSSFLDVAQNLQRRLSTTGGHEGVGLPAVHRFVSDVIVFKLLSVIFAPELLGLKPRSPELAA